MRNGRLILEPACGRLPAGEILSEVPLCSSESKDHLEIIGAKAEGLELEPGQPLQRLTGVQPNPQVAVDARTPSSSSTSTIANHQQQ